MRVLWVTDEPPHLHGGGGHIRQAHLLRAVADVADVHLVLAGRLEDDELRSRLAAVEEVDAPSRAVESSPVARRWRDLRHAALSRLPEETVAREEQRARLAPLLRDARLADVVLLEHLGLAPLLARRAEERWAISIQYAASVQARQHALVASSRRVRWLWRREAAKAARAEHAARESFDLLFAVSAEDAAVLSADAIVPNGVDLDALQPAPLPAEPRLVLTGTLSYLPNVDGATWFCDEVLPLVQAKVPGATLEIVGRDPVGEVLALARRAGVTIAANVPSVLPHLHAARVAVVPLRAGAGTRVKALEAMGAGRPVAGTPIGLAGLELQPGQHAVVEERADRLASGIVELLTDDRLAVDLAGAGRRFVEERYDWSRIGPRFAERLLASPATSP